MRQAIKVIVIAYVLLFPVLSAYGEQADVLVAHGVIDPVMARFIDRGIGQAEAEHAQCAIIELDTPGGLDSAMRAIVQRIMGARVPIVVYVAPSGARAASAGVFITLAANIAAMAPATNIGAAHPVSVTGGNISGTMETKVVNDAVAYIRAIAEKRGKNADWAEKAVRKSVSLTAQEALNNGVIDLIAPTIGDLLAQLNGRTVELLSGTVILHTAGARLHWIRMSFPERFIHTLIDPNIAYLLFTLGMWGIIAEFFHPGMYIPGLTGAILLVLGFIAFGSLPVNWGGIGLILLGIILFILDIKVTGFILSIFGAVSFILGSLLLFRPFHVPSPALPRFTVNPWEIVAVTAGLFAFFGFAVTKVITSQHTQVATGVTRVVGMTGEAVTPLNPTGIVRVSGEEWSAQALDPPIAAGEHVIVRGVDRLTLKVQKRNT